jgi:hypothetical protein
MSGRLLQRDTGWCAPCQTGWPTGSAPAQTVTMAKQPKKRRPAPKPKADTRARAAARNVPPGLEGLTSISSAAKIHTAQDLRSFAEDVRPATNPVLETHPHRQRDGSVQGTLLPDVDRDDLLAEIRHPLHGVDAYQELLQALELVGIDPAHVHEREYRSLLRELTARTTHSEQVALAVEHAEDARALTRAKVRTDPEGAAQLQALRARVLATMYLRRNHQPPEGTEDDRRPLLMDGEIIGLVHPHEDARSTLLTVKLPKVVIDRLRDAAAALGPDRTMAGIVSLGVQMVLDQLEAGYIRCTGHRFPKRPGQVLEGGRPSRMRTRDAQPAPKAAKPKKSTRLRD